MTNGSGQSVAKNETDWATADYAEEIFYGSLLISLIRKWCNPWNPWQKMPQAPADGAERNFLWICIHIIHV